MNVRMLSRFLIQFENAVHQPVGIPGSLFRTIPTTWQSNDVFMRMTAITCYTQSLRHGWILLVSHPLGIFWGSLSVEISPSIHWSFLINKSLGSSIKGFVWWSVQARDGQGCSNKKVPLYHQSTNKHSSTADESKNLASQRFLKYSGCFSGLFSWVSPYLSFGGWTWICRGRNAHQVRS